MGGGRLEGEAASNSELRTSAATSGVGLTRIAIELGGTISRSAATYVRCDA